jgi:type II secretory ATPase GspE/PulE/Tfp pilus assembly ATPase PilB-like protein
VNTENSIIDIVDKLINDAVAHRASDIHLESQANALRVRWRIDGVLYDKEMIENIYMPQVLSRIKVLAAIDITEKRVPHDGKFQFIVSGQEVDLRVSSFPSIYGEKIVIRILDRTQHMITLDNLGFSPNMLRSFEFLLARANGFFLVSGPTGSGKTTTLYAALSALNSPEKNVVTLEDPVEYSLDGITQSQIHPEVGFTFEKGIRSLLRQDPDVVMIGEIRDRQTAQVAVEASLTGHVVLSTIHTNDAPTVIMRLIDMGIEPFLVNAAVSGVLAQRLARMICPACRVQVEPTYQEAALLKRLGVEPMMLFKGSGCEHCYNLGYKGRVGIFELLAITPALRTLITQKPSIDMIVNQALEDGMQTLVVDGLDKVKQGTITLAELARTLL